MNFLKDKSKECTFYFIGFILIGLSIILSILQAKGVLLISHLLPPCLFHRITHLPCPGCGMTRAMQALFSFQFVDSFFYHPVALYCAIFYIFFMTSYTLAIFSHRFHKPKFHIAYVYIGITLMFLQWFIKILNIASSVIN